METRGTSDGHFSLTLTMDDELTTYSEQGVKTHMHNTVHSELKHTCTTINVILYTLTTLYQTLQITTIQSDVAMTQALTYLSIETTVEGNCQGTKHKTILLLYTINRTLKI